VYLRHEKGLLAVVMDKEAGGREMVKHYEKQP